ncbi:twitching motility protein PilT [Spirochaetia bacterium]|nr:twitching motility protein PilT [Spirochaetia bacterium]GHU32037.1 twitching motility protein PilT [Spirochaetia bacterium]
MVVLIDTNVIIDALTYREPFMQNAKAILNKCRNGEIIGYIAAYTVPTIFYILQKHFSVSERRDMLSKLCRFIDVAGISKQHVINAIENEHFNDLEDCLQMECAASIGADYIVTRNTDDFSGSTIPTVLPGEFLVKLEAVYG